MPQQFSEMNYPAAYAPISQGIRNVGQSLGATTQAVVDPLVARYRNNQQTQITYAQLNELFGDLSDEAGVDINSLAPQKDEQANAYKQRVAPSVALFINNLTEKGFDPNQFSSAIAQGNVSYDTFKGFIDQHKYGQFKKAATATPQPVPTRSFGDVSAANPTVQKTGIAEQEGYGNANQRLLSSVPTELSMEQAVAPIRTPEQARAEDQKKVSSFPQTLEAMQSTVMQEAPPQAMDRPAPYAKGMQRTAEEMNVEGFKPVQEIIGRQRNVEAGRGFLENPSQTTPEFLASQAAEGSDLTGAVEPIGKAIRGESDFGLNEREQTEIERHNRAMEEISAAKASQSRSGITLNALTPDELVALNRAVQNGLDPYKINSRTQKAYAQMEMLEPGRAWNDMAADAIFQRSQGTMNTKALLNAINPVLDKLLVSGQKLGNSRVQFLNRGINFLKEQSGDPDIVQFNNQRDDVIAEVERGLLGSGVLSDSKYMRALHNVNSAQSYPQLEAAVRAMKIVIEERLRALHTGPNFGKAEVHGPEDGVGFTQNIPQIRSTEEYDALPPGPYIDPNGVKRNKR